MRNSLLYRLSLGLSVILTIAAFFTFLGWIGALINGWGSQPALALIPWTPVVLLALTAINCTVRARIIVYMRPRTSEA